MKLNASNHKIKLSEGTPKMPVLFLGHGNPMNAIEENEFVKNFRKVSSEIIVPKAILVISAHWETRGTSITAMVNPPIIYDFYGFPKELYDVQYSAPGNPELAAKAQDLIKSSHVYLEYQRGLDHGTWSVISQMYPKANIPVIQLSLNYNKNPREHYELAKELRGLRDKGVLIIGSGNLVHNLSMMHWGKMYRNYAYDWAQEATHKMNEYILKGDHEKLINYTKQGKEFRLSVPTPEHFLPLLYTLAIRDKDDDIDLFNNKLLGGSLSMVSVKMG